MPEGTQDPRTAAADPSAGPAEVRPGGPREGEELRRRGMIAATALVAGHLLYTGFQVVSLLLSWHSPFIDVGVLWFSVGVNLGLNAVAAAYLWAMVRLGRQQGAGRAIHRLTVSFALVVLGVWGIQLHIGGSQSSHMLAVVLSTLLVFAWVLPTRSLVLVAVLETAWLLVVVGLEIAGLIPYSPLLPPVQGVRGVFLDGRVLAMNAAIFVYAMTGTMGVMLATRRSVRRHRSDLRHGNELLRHEVSQREQAQTTLRRAVEELTRANEDLRRLIQAAAHDLRSPMTVIDGYATLLKEEMAEPSDDRARGHVEHLERGAQHMRRLLDDLSRLVLVDDREVPLVPCDAGRVVEGVVALFELQAREAGARIEVGELPRVLADEVRLARIFQNLLGNALKFRSATAPWVRIDAHPEGAGWCFRVQDNGIGIPPDQAERIFEPFVRLQAGGRGDGSGIGLSVCRRAVEAMGGAIRVEARPGGGSVFLFTLRAA